MLRFDAAIDDASALPLRHDTRFAIDYAAIRRFSLILPLFAATAASPR